MTGRIFAIFFATVMWVLGAASPAAAGGVDEVRVGAFAQSVGGYSPDKEQGVGVNLEALFSSPGFLRRVGAPRPHVGVMIATDPDATSQVYAGLEWKAELFRRFFVAGGVGGSVHNGETDPFDPAVDLPRLNNTMFLGCRVLVRLSADIGYRVSERVSASVNWNHISNADLCDENEGLDNVGMRVGYQF